jgi:hypothetical protein
MNTSSIILLSVTTLLAVFLLVRHWRTWRGTLKLLGLAFGLGAITETILCYAFFLGGGGGASRTFLGDAAYAIHIPGLALSHLLGIDGSAAMLLTPWLYCSIWTCGWLLAIRRIYSRAARRDDMTHDHAA